MTIDSLMKDRQFLEKLYEARDIDEILALFAREGVDVTAEEIMDRMLPSGEDLTEEQLETVSGGGSVLNSFRIMFGFGRR